MNWKIWLLFAGAATMLFMDTVWSVFWWMVGRNLDREDKAYELLEQNKRRRQDD